MGKSTAMVEAGNAMVSLLRAHLTPDIITNPDSIGLCSPDERGDILLGVHLYDVKESEEVRRSERVMVDSRSQRYPSNFLTLSYMITAFSSADTKFKSAEEQKVLGKVIQVLSDYSRIQTDGEMDMRIMSQQLNIDEKQKLWQFPNMAYKLSLFYKVSPVEIESERIKSTQRVVEAQFVVEDVPQNGGKYDG